MQGLISSTATLLTALAALIGAVAAFIGAWRQWRSFQRRQTVGRRGPGPGSGGRPRSVPIWVGVGIALTLVAVVGFIVGSTVSRQTSGSSSPASTNQSLPIPSGLQPPLEAQVYFGQLGAVLARLSSVHLKPDQEFRKNQEDLCVETVLVSNMPGPTGWVVATGVDEGWGRMEQYPDTKVAGPEHSVHQQLLIPPLTAAAGAQWTGAAKVFGDGIAASIATGRFTLSLEERVGSRTEWALDGQKVECSIR